MSIVFTGNDWGKVCHGDTAVLKNPVEGQIIASDYFPSFSNSISPFNLGVYYDEIIDSDTVVPVLHGSRYVGVMPLLKRTGSLESKGTINIESRFNISPTQMLKEVLVGDDYYEHPDMLKTHSYKAHEWQHVRFEKDILFGVLTGFGRIEINTSNGEGGNALNKHGISINNDENGVFEIIDFINKAKEVCKNNLKKQSQQVEENLTCKVKGRIIIQKQIKYNESRGQMQKTYCAFNRMSLDIKENQIIKYALHLCKLHPIGDALAEEIDQCMRSLSGIPLKKCSASDFVGLKNNGAYREYKEALLAAKHIITRYSVDYSADSAVDSNNNEAKLKLSTNVIQPYFINIDLLFEYYCRALFSKVIRRFNRKNNTSFVLESSVDSERRLFDKNGFGKCFMNTYIPDIVIKYDNRIAAVIDAKDSNIEGQSTEKRRARTHQVMFYMKALDCNNGALISPCQRHEGDSDKPITKPLLINNNEPENGPHMSYIPMFYGMEDSDNNHEDIIYAYLEELNSRLNY